MLKIGVIGIPGKWSTEVLADAVQSRTGFRLVIDMAQVTLDLASGRLFYAEHDLCALDGLIVKKISASYSPDTLDRLQLLRIAEQAGVRVFSRAENILGLINRLSCTLTLQQQGIPMPATRITEDVNAAIAAVRDFGSAVFKPLYSTKARGMCVIDSQANDRQLAQQIRAFQTANRMMYIQQKIELPGQDLGLVFLGNRYQAAYARVSRGNSWNTTILEGGRYANHQASDEIIELAYRAQAAFDMDFTTVDVAETQNGPVVFEVSAFGGFRGAKQGCGIDIAERYTDYVLTELGADYVRLTTNSKR